MQTDYEIWSDGSCHNPGPGTTCTHIYQSGRLIKEITTFDPTTTNNRMEIIAVLLGLKWCPDQSRIRFYCDNDYVVCGFNDWMHKWVKIDMFGEQRWKNKKNLDLWRNMLFEHKRLKAKGIWVKAHIGIPNNEKCDLRASELLESFTGQAPRY